MGLIPCPHAALILVLCRQRIVCEHKIIQRIIQAVQRLERQDPAEYGPHHVIHAVRQQYQLYVVGDSTLVDGSPAGKKSDKFSTMDMPHNRSITGNFSWCWYPCALLL